MALTKTQVYYHLLLHLYLRYQEHFAFLSTYDADFHNFISKSSKLHEKKQVLMDRFFKPAKKIFKIAISAVLEANHKTDKKKYVQSISHIGIHSKSA